MHGVPGEVEQRAPRTQWGPIWAVFYELGVAMIALGVLALVLAGYLVWGTRLTEERSQASLQRNFEEAVSASQRPTIRHPVTSVQGPFGAGAGAVDRLVIPAMGLDAFVVNGVSEQDLALGPGHYPGTALPGRAGNAAIAGHRTTYGAPFFNLDSLRRGDRIFVTDQLGRRFVYAVSRLPFAVPPNDVSVLQPTAAPRLTLTTCTPRYWATARLVVVARLLGPPLRPTPSSRVLMASDHSRPASRTDPSSRAPPGGWAVLLLAAWAASRVAARCSRGGPRLAVLVGVGALWLGLLWLAVPAIALRLSPTL
jgi:sortase A